MNKRRITFAFLCCGHLATAQTYPASRPASRPTTASATRATSAPVATLPPATLVTLHLKDVPARDAFAQLFQQTEAAMDIDASLWDAIGNPPVTLEVVDQPFLVALKELCQLTKTLPANSPDGLPSIFPRDPAVALNMRRSTGSRPRRPGPAASSRPAAKADAAPLWIDQPAIAAGAFLFVPTHIEQRSHVTFSHPDHIQGRTTIYFTVLAEPQLHLFAAGMEFDLSEALDANGQSLLGDDSRRTNPSTQERWMWDVRAYLDSPPRSGRIATLRGTLRAQGLTHFQTVEIPNIMHAGVVEKTVADLHFKVGPARAMSQRYEISIEVFRDEQPPEQWQQTKKLARSVRGISILDADGRRRPASHGAAHQDEDVVALTIYLTRPRRPDPAEKPPEKLVWQIGEEAQEILIPLEMKDIPLP